MSPDRTDESDQPDQPRGTAASRRRIGEIFVERGFVDETELDEALKAQKETGQPLGEVLIGRGTLSRLDLASALAEQWAGLEKLRPPSPKRVEGWQQVAPVEHAAAAAQGATRTNDAQSPGPALDAALAEAVTELSDRIAAVEANGAPAASADTLAAAIETLTVRLDGIEGGLVVGRSDSVADEIGALRDALSELRERLAEPEARLGLVEGRVNELESDRSALDGIRSRLAALEKRIAEQASRDDLDGVTGELTTRLDGLDARLEVAATGARSGLDAVLETLAGVQDRIDAVEASPQTGEHDHAEIAALQARLEEIAGASSAAGALAERLEALEAAGSATPWRDELSGLQARLDELNAAGAAATDLAERLVAMEAAVGATPWRAEVSALQARLDELAVGAVDDGLAERLAAVEAATPWRDEVSALQARLEQLATSGGAVEHLDERLASLESAGAATPWRDEIAALQPRVDELASSVAASVDSLGERLAAIEASSLAAPRREEIAALQTRLQELAASGVAVDGVVERLTALEGRDPGAAWRDEIAALQPRVDELASSVAASVDSLGERLAAIEASSLAAPRREEIAALQTRLQELAASGVAVDGVVERLTALEGRDPGASWRDEIAALQERVDALGAGATAADGLAERLAAVEATTLERPWRAELSRLADEFGVRLDGLGERLAEAGGTGPEVDDLRTGLDRLEARLAGTAAADHGHEEIAALQVRLEELVAARPPDELIQRLSAVETVALERPWRAELHRLAEEVGARLDGLTGRLDEADGTDHEQLEQLRAALEALAKRQEQTARADHGHAEFAALESRLEALAPGTAVDDLTKRLAAVEAARAATPWRADLAALAARLDDVGADLARVPREEVAALRTDLDALREAAGDAERGAVSRLAELSKRLDDIARATAELQAAAEAGASAVDRSELERVELLVEEIGAAAREATRTAESANSRNDELASADAAARESLDAELRRRIDGAAKKLRSDLGAIGSRVDGLTESLSAVAQNALGSQHLDSALAAQETRLTDRLGAYDEAIVMLRRRLEEIAALDGVLGERLSTIEGGLTVRLDETAAALTADAASARDALDALVNRLASVEQHVSATPGALHMLHTELSTLASRVESAEAAARADSGWPDAVETLGSRLGAVEAELAARDDQPTRSRLDELEHRLDAEAAQADERTKVTERALRKGLATLGERLAETESAYTEAGNALRRSIERLGRAIVETDGHLATADDPETQVTRTTGAYVAFAPTPDGYRLIVIDGGMPEVGHTVELDGHESPLVVTRVGASPIPLDDRPCAYLERSGLTPS